MLLPLHLNGLNLDSGAVVVVPAQQPAGGWKFFNAYEKELARRREAERKREQLIEELEDIEEQVDQEIAVLLHEEDDEAERQREQERLRFLVRKVSAEQVEKEFGDRVAKAYQRTLEKGTYSALEALVREAKRAQEEEHLLLIALMME